MLRSSPYARLPTPVCRGIGTKVIFKITDLARLRQFYPSTKSSSTILPMGLAHLKDQVIFANAEHGKASIAVLNANRGTAVRQITSPTISSPSGLCLSNEKFFVSCSSHIVVKLDLVTVIEVVCDQANKPGNQDGVASSAMLQSPCGIATMGSSLFICDTGNRSIK